MNQQENKTFTFHDPDKRYTVVGSVINNENNKTMSFGVSIRNRKDHFNRKMGRQIAMGRAFKNPLFVLDLHEGEDVKETFYKEALAFKTTLETTEIRELHI